MPIGKTGTSDSSVRSAVRDKIMMSAFACRGRRYVAFALIGSPSMDIPLGRIQAGDLAHLIDALLSAHMSAEKPK